MEYPDLNKLKEIIKLCRSLGVSSFKFGELNIELGFEPIKEKRSSKKEVQKDVDETAPSEEDLLFWSSSQEDKK